MSEACRKELVQRLTKNFLDIQLLRMIAAEPMWGYKIKKTVETNLGIKLRHGALYPLLNQLEKDGFVQSTRQPEAGRARKVYTVTGKGNEFLECYRAVLRDQMKE